MTDIGTFTEIIQNKQKTKCYSKISFGLEEILNIKFINKIDQGVLSDKQGITQVQHLGHSYEIGDFGYFYPDHCADTFITHIDIAFLKRGNWNNHRLAVYYSSDEYKKQVFGSAMGGSNAYRKLFVNDKKKTEGCYSEIKFSGAPRYVQFTNLPSKGIISNKSGTTAAALNTPYLAEDFAYFYPDECTGTFARDVSVRLYYNGDWVDNDSIFIYYNGNNNLESSYSYYDNMYQWAMCIKDFLVPLYLINLYLRRKDNDGYKVAKAVNAESARIHGAAAIVMTFGEFVSVCAIVLNNMGITIKDEVGGTIDVNDISDVVLLNNREQRTISNAVTPKNIGVIRKLIAEVTNIAQIMPIAVNEVIQGAYGRIKVAVDHAGRAYNSSHIGVRRTIHIVIIASAIFVKNLFDNGFDGKEEGVIYDFKQKLKTIPSAGRMLWANSDVSNVKEQKPIGIELELGRAIDIIDLRESTTYFSYSDEGALSRTSWVGPNDAILFYDFNGTGQADHWSKFVMTEWSGQYLINDFDALLEVFDTNHDMIFDAQDALYNDFCIWQDANSNGAVEAGELTQLIEAGIVSINFNTTEKPSSAPAPAPTSSDIAVVEWVDGHTTFAHDLAFQYEVEAIAIA